VYTAPYFSLSEPAAWEQARQIGAATAVVATTLGLRSVHVPVTVDEAARTVRGHVARANKWWRDAATGDEVVAVFHAASAYVSPTLYPSRLADPGVVPTLDYVAVEARGIVTIVDDPTWLDGLVRELTDRFESARGSHWSVDDAPAAHVQSRLRAIVGFEVSVAELTGVAKLSQNRPVEDRANVHREFADGSPSERMIARSMDELA
jgi:transcriptional regulator